jgi:hypothetical protein
MHKNQQVKYAILSAIAISTILVASTVVAGLQYSHQAFAQNTNNTSTAAQNQTSTAAQNQTSTAAPSKKSAAGTIAEPPANKNFVWQGTVSSSPGSLPGHENEQVTTILAPRKEGAVYSGILTYQASRPVHVVVWNEVNAGNKSAIPEQFGNQDLIKVGNKFFALTEIGGTARSGSVPFTGNAVELVKTGDGDNPFTATYSVNALATKPKIVNRIESAMSFNSTTSGGG